MFGGGILGKALSGIGGGMGTAAVMSYKDQLEAAREERLAQLQSQRDDKLFGQQQTLEQSKQDFQSGQTDKTIGANKDLEGLRYEHNLIDRGMQISADYDRLKEQLDSHERIAAAQEKGANARAGAANSIAKQQLELTKDLKNLEMDAKKIDIERAKRVDKLTTEFENPDTTPERKNEIVQALNILTPGSKEASDKYVNMPGEDPMAPAMPVNTRTKRTIAEERAGVSAGKTGGAAGKAEVDASKYDRTKPQGAVSSGAVATSDKRGLLGNMGKLPATEENIQAAISDPSLLGKWKAQGFDVSDFVNAVVSSGQTNAELRDALMRNAK